MIPLNQWTKTSELKDKISLVESKNKIARESNTNLGNESLTFGYRHFSREYVKISFSLKYWKAC